MKQQLIRLPEELYYALKQRALDERKSVQELLSGWIASELRKDLREKIENNI